MIPQNLYCECPRSTIGDLGTKNTSLDAPQAIRSARGLWMTMSTTTEWRYRQLPRVVLN